MGKIGRNDPCVCGSGKKYKKCCLDKFRAPSAAEQITDVFGAFGTNPIEQSIQQKRKRGADAILANVLDDKKKASRTWPSSKLVSSGEQPSLEDRKFLVDACARLVDENWCGRSEMCIYFAALIRHGLSLLGYHSVVEVGKATYSMGGETFEWDHAWVRTESNEIIDGNVDAMHENPFVPSAINPNPYWGDANALPSDRTFRTVKTLPPERDNIELDADEIRTWKAALEIEVDRYRNSKAE